METIYVCPKCYSLFYGETEITSTKVLGKLMLPNSFIYAKVVSVKCKNCKDESERKT